MKRFFFFILLVLGSSASLHAQFARTDPRVEWELTFLKKNVEPLYRKPTRKELKAIEPRRALFDEYAGFLRQPKTGLTKLIDDKGCAENTKVVVATDNCLKYTMPGAGSSFSFRTQTYRIPRLADLTFTDKSFQAAGVLLHGIFANIGNVPLEEVSLQTKGLKYLVDFQPEPDYEKGKELDLQLIEGIKSDGFLYRRGLFSVENTTFALRSIAYSGKYFRAVKNLTYNEFDFDKRRDVIVVFRIVEKDEAGNVTILWKELQEKDSPEVKR
ncbi:MAG TPA: hypothetical protein VNB22_15950 [Pyrinomonadaceae bacterium]|nr:hypothetical protein [Pyrinomonadaceae bacterium]